MRKLKEKLDKIFDVKSYGYVVDKRITRSAFVLIIVLALFVLFVDGADVFINVSFYYECPCNSSYCVDPFSSVLEPEYMLPCSSVGVKPSWLAQNFGWVSFLIFVSALGWNHIKNNRKVKK